MASDTSIKFYGAGHLAGKTVQVAIAGVDMGDYTVASDGTVTVPFGVDAQGIVTPQYLAALPSSTLDNAAQVTFYADDVQYTKGVPVTIGLGYTTKGQTLRPALGQDLGLRVNGLGKMRRAHEYAVLLNYATDAVLIGTTFTNTDPLALTTADGETAWPADTLYTGVYRGRLTDDYGYDSMLCWQVSRPVALMVCAISAFLVASES